MTGPERLPRWHNPSKHPAITIAWDVAAIIGEHSLNANPLQARAAMPEHMLRRLDELFAALESAVRGGGTPT